jgi:hypothetical protein
MIVVFALTFLFFILFLLAHASIFHLFSPARKFRCMFFTALIFAAACGLIVFLIPEKLISKCEGMLCGAFEYLLAAVYFYFFLWYFYFHTLVVIDRSISVRMLLEIYEAPGGALSLEELKERYSLDEKFTDEIRDMVFLDRFRVEGNFCCNTRKASLQAKIFKFLKEYLNLTAK